jgi:murein DD-endopeptidase MepM/ murein hydrolase activator NlpD
MGEMIAETPGRGGKRPPANNNHLSLVSKSPHGFSLRLLRIRTASAAVAFALCCLGRLTFAAGPDQEAAESSAVAGAVQSPRPEEAPAAVGQPAEVVRPAEVNQTEPAQSSAVAAPPETPASYPTPPQDQSGSVALLARQALAEARRLLASTGLNIDRLFPQLALDRGQGGPFVAPPKGDQLKGTVPDKREELRSLIKSLPLTVPLDYYQLESRFGPRRDPFNHRPSFHTGIDLSAPYMSQVHATGAGTVIYAGYRSDYGKVVEISHGNGIATVYGHLHRHVVSVGQPVGEHDLIGYLGSTGRSSGPHVHYEVLVNDEPQDPEKFIGLARVIPIADR